MKLLARGRADMIGEDLDVVARREKLVRQSGHQIFNAADIRPKALGGDGDQGGFFQRRGGGAARLSSRNATQMAPRAAVENAEPFCDRLAEARR